jgi:hypothetical protein
MKELTGRAEAISKHGGQYAVSEECEVTVQIQEIVRRGQKGTIVNATRTCLSQIQSSDPFTGPNTAQEPQRRSGLLASFSSENAKHAEDVTLKPGNLCHQETTA